MLSASDAAERAVHHVTAMTGRAAESVIGIEPIRPDGRDGAGRPGRGQAGKPGAAEGDKAEGGTGTGTDKGADKGGKNAGDGGTGNGDGGGCGAGGWRVIVEVVETRRIPDSADILATYQAEIDGDGDLVSYRRLHRYLRGRTGRD